MVASIPSNCNDLQDHPFALSISDDDFCSDCANLLYCPGDRSLCELAEYDGEWPCVWNADDYSVSCIKFKE